MPSVVDARSLVPDSAGCYRRKNEGEGKPSNDLPIGFVIFTDHAISQFTQRFERHEGTRLSKPIKTARRILASAIEPGAISKTGRLKRLLENRCVPVRYFLNGIWRFVVKEENGKFIVITIEIANEVLKPKP